MPARSPTILLVEPFQDATSANELWPNPNDTELIAEYGMRLALSGEWVRGCPLIEQAHARNPSPQADYEVMLGLCSYMQGDYRGSNLRPAWRRECGGRYCDWLSYRR
jgi:hypothetical protein